MRRRVLWVSDTPRAAGRRVPNRGGDLLMTDPCANTDQCHYWPRHDDRCDRNTEPHSAMCSKHEEHDYSEWYFEHSQDEHCPSHCPLLHEEDDDD